MRNDLLAQIVLALGGLINLEAVDGNISIHTLNLLVTKTTAG